MIDKLEVRSQKLELGTTHVRRHALEAPAADEAPQEQADDKHNDKFRDADRAEIHGETLRA